MSHLGILEPGNRHDLRVGISPDAPDESRLEDQEGAFGYAHSYETSSRYDGPGFGLFSSFLDAFFGAPTVTIPILGT